MGLEAVVALLTAILGVVPSLSGSAAIASIIAQLVSALPTIVKVFTDAVPIVKNIIAALQNHNDVTPEQWAELDKLNADCDAAFEEEAGKFNPDGSLKGQ